MNKPRLIDAELVVRNIARHKTVAIMGATKELEEAMAGYDPRGFIWGFQYGMELACKLVSKQPTAYDVDKVLEQLEVIAFTTEDWMCGGTTKVVELSDAIEIVKGGAK